MDIGSIEAGRTLSFQPHAESVRSCLALLELSSSLMIWELYPARPPDAGSALEGAVRGVPCSLKPILAPISLSQCPLQRRS